MGVPAYFRKLTKKHKIVKSNPEKRIKSLYFDNNCLLHPQCFKTCDLFPDETDPIILFEKMLERILGYMDYIIRMINPEELVYIAVDGVAPLAKIIQSRSRRFGYANNYRHEIYRKYGINFNDSWSNIVITPGTEFMYDLHIRMKKYFSDKVKNNTDPLCKYKIVYSSYMTPGEGEHKILQHIKSHYDPNDDRATVIYGLDADLIFLAMASDCPNIYLLRETSHYNRDESEVDDKEAIEEELCFADIDFAKQSINNEFNEYYTKFITCNNDDYTESELFGQENVEKKEKKMISSFNFCNDYIFICYFLGNDFLPHLPSIDICNDGLETIINAYMDVFQELGRNMIRFIDGKVSIDQEFILTLITLLANKEEDYFRRILPEYLKKQYNKKCYYGEPHKKEIWRIENLKNVRIYDAIRLGDGYPDEWKYRYYSHYFKTDEHMQETVENICQNYLEGLLWVARYYFEKCTAWKWQYKYTHAPFLSDLSMFLQKKNIMKDFNVKDSEPVSMYTQLLAVVPSTYSKILPKNLRTMNSSIDSPIIDLYPLTYQIDMIYKTQLYKCVPIIPYLDIERIERAIEDILKKSNYSEKEILRSQIMKPLLLGKCNSDK
jgi:5'-3' exonuclease